MKTQVSKFAVGAQAQVNNLAELEAIADAFYMEELEKETELEAIADAFYMEELAREAELEAIADSMMLM